LYAIQFNAHFTAPLSDFFLGSSDFLDICCNFDSFGADNETLFFVSLIFFPHSIELKSEMLQALDSGHCHWIFQSLFFL
jgi:hypothetical protein